jgi:hypothetical protein
LLSNDDGDPNTADCHDFPQTDVVGRVRYFAETRGTRRLQGFNELNARIEWKPKVGKKGNLGVILDAFNLLNYTQVTERRDRDDGFFDEPVTWNIGRNLRFGIRYEF